MIRDMPKPEVGPGLIPVKVRYCSICGSDVHTYKDNNIPRALQELVEMLPSHGQGVIVSAYEHTPRIDFNTVMLKSLDLQGVQGMDNLFPLGVTLASQWLNQGVSSWMLYTRPSYL